MQTGLAGLARLHCAAGPLALSGKARKVASAGNSTSADPSAGWSPPTWKAMPGWTWFSAATMASFVPCERESKPRMLWSVPLGRRVGKPVVADPNGDGRPAILVNVEDGRLYCLKGKQKLSILGASASP